MQIGDKWGQRPMFLDLRWIPESERLDDGRHPLEGVLNDCRDAGLSAIPVTGGSRDSDYQAAVRDAAQKDNLGVCLRVESEELELLTTAPDTIVSLAQDRDLWRWSTWFSTFRNYSRIRWRPSHWQRRRS